MTEEQDTQGLQLGATAAQVALEHTVSQYHIGVGGILGHLAEVAHNLAEDGYTLEQFSTLLAGNDIE